MNRRSFLGAAVALGAVGACRQRQAETPLVMGDGVHDDTRGLQAMISGKPFHSPTGCAMMLEDGRAFFGHGTFRLSEPLDLRLMTQSLLVREFTVIAEPSCGGHAMICAFDHQPFGSYWQNGQFIGGWAKFTTMDGRPPVYPTSIQGLRFNDSYFEHDWLQPA